MTCLCEKGGTIGLVFAAGLIIATNLLYYGVYISPHYFLERPGGFFRLPDGPVVAGYALAYIFSIARLPFAFLPYLAKLVCFLTLGQKFKKCWDAYWFQLLRWGGDFANLLLTAVLLSALFNLLQASGWVCLVVYVEVLRLMTEKGQMIASAAWQRLPHASLVQQSARLFDMLQPGTSLYRLVRRYHDYYSLPTSQKGEMVLETLKRLAKGYPEMAGKLRYVNGLRIVPDEMGLRSGAVRDIPRGEIYIHAAWVNDPWLLAGQVLRRSPWVFDPRYVKRPFYYRTGSNRLATFFVWRYGLCAAPYACYQLGQEIKVARYDLFYRLLRRCGVDWERPVLEDGAFEFDALLGWIGRRLHMDQAKETRRVLWTDEEVIALLVSKNSNAPIPPTLEIAAKYAYPLVYVEEVLLPVIEAGRLETHPP